MLIQTRNNGFVHPVSSEITPRGAYEGRRDLLKLMATGVAGAAIGNEAERRNNYYWYQGGCYRKVQGGYAQVSRRYC